MSDDDYIQEEEDLQDIIYEKMFPALSKLDETYPEHSAFFSMFISCLYVLFDSGWTEEELNEAVEEHHQNWLKMELEDNSAGGLH